jgi:2-polyprenyl-3-methyl-5-hydroxy-6-metoxy-1,4-benzoquinol methylase
MDHAELVADVIEAHRVAPIDMLGIGDTTSEYAYLSSHKESYTRTVNDVDGLFEDGRLGKRILEIGSFLGPVSIALRRLGFEVHATDIPEFHQSAALRSLYHRNGIRFDGVNLRHGKLPYEESSFDVVVLCEVMEHFNFNPLPVLKEINRVLRPGGHIYIGMPNQTSILNRKKMLLGRSVNSPIGDLFKQLDKTSNMIVGLHWREYTMAETVEILSAMGFKTTKSYYFREKAQQNVSLLNKLAYLYPPFRPFQVVMGKKASEPSFDFWRTEANS